MKWERGAATFLSFSSEGGRSDSAGFADAAPFETFSPAAHSKASMQHALLLHCTSLAVLFIGVNFTELENHRSRQFFHILHQLHSVLFTSK